MDDKTKNRLYSDQKSHVKQTVTKIQEEISKASELINYNKNYKADTEDSASRAAFRAASLGWKIEDLEIMKKSPYFSRCDVISAGTNELKTFYFSKFSFPEENIYSWVAPSAKMRFEDIGDFNFETLSNNKISAKLTRKDNYMIENEDIIFMSSESYEYERTLIYQKYLSSHKKVGFQMQEIIAMMEKAQDQVIRANPYGSFLISGPAGSGKTTLALHRVAYLAQSPETSTQFSNDKIIVFVQDKSTKDYFSALLPNLGINQVTILTWVEWALEKLDIIDSKYSIRIGENEEEKDQFEFEKINALKNINELNFEKFKIKDKNHFKILEKIYSKYLSKECFNIFQKQIKNNEFDRFDLTILFKIKSTLDNGIFFEYIDYIPAGKGKLRRKLAKDKIEYSLIILDEAQNYLPEQIEITKKALNPKTNSILFVGDLIQQTNLGTIRDWNSIGENFDETNKVTLTKVYRNTKQIIEYINSVGFDSNLSDLLKNGKEVVEQNIELEKQILEINKIINTNKEKVIGILVKSDLKKQILINKLNVHANVKIMTMNESQGVEFDIAILAFIESKDFVINKSFTEIQQKEKIKVNKDLMYVALTRAISELYVFSDIKLKTIIGNFKL